MSEAVISHHHHRTARREWGRARNLSLSALLGFLIGVLGLAIAVSTVDVVRAAIVEEAATVEPVVEYPARELPREWQWQPKGLEYEHMYMQRKSPRSDWIRKGSGR